MLLVGLLVLADLNLGTCIGRPLACGGCVVHGCLRAALSTSHCYRLLPYCLGALALTQSQLATLLTGLSTRPAQHQQMLLRMAAQVGRMEIGVAGQPGWHVECKP